MLARGEIAVPPTRDAATVALLRDAADGPEVYLLRRVRGDGLRRRDARLPRRRGRPRRRDVEHRRGPGPPPSAFAAAFGCDEPLARALVCAAVRETFEESGVLLAGPSADEVLADVSTDEWEAERPRSRPASSR